MQVSVETTSGLGRKMTVAVEEDRINKAVEERLKSMSKTVRMNGFRKGKVPMHVVRQQYASQVRGEVLGDVLQTTFYEAVTQEKLRPAGMPKFDANKMVAGSGMEYTATFEVYPEISLADMSGVSIERPTTTITDADLDDMIDTIRGQQKNWVAVDRAAKSGDKVNIDFVGTVEGEKFQGGEAKGAAIELGSGRMIPGFEDGLEGVKAGDDVTLKVTFPAEYHAKDLAGKAAEFATHVNSVEESQLPELDAEFAKKMGVADGDVAKFKDEIRESMQRELATRIKAQTKTAVLDKLLEKNSFDVPAALVESESEVVMKQTQQNLAAQGIPAGSLKMEASMFKDQAERRVKLGLMMAEIIDNNKIKVSADQVKAKVEEIAAPYEQPAEVVKWYYSNKQRLQEVESLAMEEAVVDWVMNQAKVVDKKQSFKEIMNPESEK